MQRNNNVCTYVYCLENLFLIMGVVSKHKRVMKRWDSFNEEIQMKLWEFEYSLTHSRWNEIVTAAIQFEIAAEA